MDVESGVVRLGLGAVKAVDMLVWDWSNETEFQSGSEVNESPRELKRVNTRMKSLSFGLETGLDEAKCQDYGRRMCQKHLRAATILPCRVNLPRGKPVL